MKKGYIFTAFKIILWILIFSWMAIVLTDYVRVKKSKEPLFCITNEVIQEKDGNIYICKGLGYKYYNYAKESYVMKKFLPLWSKDTEVEYE